MNKKSSLLICGQYPVLAVPTLHLFCHKRKAQFGKEESALEYWNLLHSVIHLSECPGISSRHLPEYKTNATKSPGMQLCFTGQELWLLQMQKVVSQVDNRDL